MELQIQDLISSIRKDGIDAARAESDAIIAAANKKAADIIAEARAEAAAKTSDAEKRIATLTEGARVNVEQAQRDAVLSFRNVIEGEFRKILAADIRKTVNGEALAALIKAALSGEDPSGYTAEVASVTEGLRGELAEEISKGLEVKIAPNVRSGFRLSAKDGSGFFDCSDEEIAEMIRPFFSSFNI